MGFLTITAHPVIVTFIFSFCNIIHTGWLCTIGTINRTVRTGASLAAAADDFVFGANHCLTTIAFMNAEMTNLLLALAAGKA